MKAFQFTNGTNRMAIASRHPFDALPYASGGILHLVELEGVAPYGPEDLVVLKTFGVSHMLREFACECALSVVHLWACPDQVLEYLQTVDDAIREEARSAANRAAPRASEEPRSALAWDSAWIAVSAKPWTAAGCSALAAAEAMAWGDGGEAGIFAETSRFRRRFANAVAKALEASAIKA